MEPNFLSHHQVLLEYGKQDHIRSKNWYWYSL